jgi:hypothetical protein
MMHPRCGRRNGIAGEFDVQFATPLLGKFAATPIKQKRSAKNLRAVDGTRGTQASATH